MKILIITRGYPSEKDPQWGCFEMDQAIALQLEGHQVAMMSVDGRFRFYWRKLGIIRSDIKGLTTYKIFWLPTSIIRRFNYKLATFIEQKLALKLYNRLQKEWGEPELIHAHFLPCIFQGLAIKNNYNKPLVATEHWSAVNNDVLLPYVQYMGSKSYQKVDSLITVSDSLRQRVLEHFGRDSKVIHNMIGNDFIRTILNIKSIPNDQFRFLVVGSLVPIKGHDTLIKAFEKSDLKKKKVKIVIIGDGPLKDSLQKQIDKAGLHDNIILAGRKQKAEIINELYKSNAFIQPSRAENFSVAVLEGLSAGLPVIATLCGGIKECINENNGILVPVDDVDCLAIALRNMYFNIEKYDKESIARDCRQRYSPSAIAREITKVYIELHNNVSTFL